MVGGNKPCLKGNAVGKQSVLKTNVYTNCHRRSSRCLKICQVTMHQHLVESDGCNDFFAANTKWFVEAITSFKRCKNHWRLITKKNISSQRFKSKKFYSILFLKILGYKMHPEITTDLELSSKLSVRKCCAL